jgi:nucleotide-binding universal stress UspA family protein
MFIDPGALRVVRSSARAPAVKNDLPTLIVAADGSPASTSDCNVADLIAEINDVDIHVVSVESATKSAEYDADLIIVRASSHGILDRLMRGETAPGIAQLGNTPLLITAAGTHSLPRRIAVAIDLDPSQLGDLTPVLSLFGPEASITCVHVQRPENFPGSDSPAFARAYENAVAESFALTREAISKVPGMRPDLIRLAGDPAIELIRYVEHVKVELLVLGLRRHYGMRRLLGGDVGLSILRGVSCSVLIVPENH